MDGAFGYQSLSDLLATPSPTQSKDQTMKANQLPMLLLALIMTLSTGLPVLAQDDGADDQPRERNRDRGNDWRERWENMSEEERAELRKRFEDRRAEMEKQRSEQLRERLEMTEEDFGLIAPMIQKVQGLVRERDMVSRGGGRGGPGQRGGGSFGIELSDEGKAVSEAMTKLREAVENNKKGDIKDALSKLRKARAAMDKLVKDAREELRGVCTPKWEGEFVVMGLLD